jgi:hypothetical protein
MDVMIIEIRAKNCFVFEEEIGFSMKADMEIRSLHPMFIKKIILMYLRQLEFMDLIMQEKHVL